uniref:Uncharacterized protein n=1 Tax=Clytia hemisphaerica TaxID=252671 RepID=A0A7M5WWN3_9CNID
MIPKLLASEFSPKVKAYNLIEENILKQRLDVYRRQEKNNLRMIEKDSKRFQEKLLQTSLKTSEGFEYGELTDELLMEEKITEASNHQHHKQKNGKLKKRRKKKSKTRDTAITHETFIYKSEQEMENSVNEKRYRNSHGFLPKLNNISVNAEPTKPAKSSDNLSLPPILGASLTSSVSLPSLNKFNKYGKLQ